MLDAIETLKRRLKKINPLAYLQYGKNAKFAQLMQSLQLDGNIKLIKGTTFILLGRKAWFPYVCLENNLIKIKGMQFEILQSDCKCNGSGKIYTSPNYLVWYRCDCKKEAQPLFGNCA